MTVSLWFSPLAPDWWGASTHVITWGREQTKGGWWEAADNCVVTIMVCQAALLGLGWPVQLVKTTECLAELSDRVTADKSAQQGSSFMSQT
eukprot:8578560-Ditylum_brightwellii.AAC.1